MLLYNTDLGVLQKFVKVEHVRKHDIWKTTKPIEVKQLQIM